jgi:hypothetical protein
MCGPRNLAASVVEQQLWTRADQRLFDLGRPEAHVADAQRAAGSWVDAAMEPSQRSLPTYCCMRSGVADSQVTDGRMRASNVSTAIEF